MSGQLRPLGPAWQPLLEASVDALVAAGLDVSELWVTRAERQAALERLGRLLDQVVTWNARIDLTAARDARQLVDLYLADALVLAAHGSPNRAPAERWVDVGSGAGAPGLALALLWPGLSLTLVEPRRKRVAFLRSAVGSFDVARAVRIVDARSDAVPSWTHDVALSRATFAPADWLAEGARLAQRRVWVLLARAEPPTLPGWQLARSFEYDWPLTSVPRHALEYSREASAPATLG
jgi:16S rRNA (guanine527-N7)-methyltransferase